LAAATVAVAAPNLTFDIVAVETAAKAEIDTIANTTSNQALACHGGGCSHNWCYSGDESAEDHEELHIESRLKGVKVKWAERKT